MDMFYDKLCCPDHPRANLIEDWRAGDLICPECALVVGDRIIDVGAEWRTFNNDNSYSANKDPSRVGAFDDMLMEHFNSQTVIEKTAARNGTTYQTKKTLSRSDGILVKAKSDISLLATRLHCPQAIIQDAILLFSKAQKGKGFMARLRPAFSAACLFIACADARVPRSMAEISGASGILAKDINKCRVRIKQDVNVSATVVDTADYISRYCGILQLPYSLQKIASHIARKAKEVKKLSSRSPISLVAAAIYMAAQTTSNPRSRLQVHEVTAVAEVSILQMYKLLFLHRSIVLPDDFKPEVELKKDPSENCLLHQPMIIHSWT